ncbi:DEKNAAC101602 [Brettanomyces naardenensis]|uniref:DEKNAAC101602 n=1 Tax=Brettanomyces naardenensis TaxID=13370 RepID=A0A448YI66_BRENA|nr:DEKNAAC101602 [Brettanomyces naardenensis]
MIQICVILIATTICAAFDFESTYLERHNHFRRLQEDTPDLNWNTSIADIAQSYADKYSCDGKLVHSGNGFHGQGLGENLAVGFDFQSATSVDAWYNEIKLYNFSDPGFAESTGHFTQLVWKSSTIVGCGFRNCGGQVGTYIVCNYFPAGNIIFEGNDQFMFFRENVQPLASSNDTSTSSPTSTAAAASSSTSAASSTSATSSKSKGEGNKAEFNYMQLISLLFLAVII